MAASTHHVISKEVENHTFKHNWIFRYYVCINNPYWQSSGIIFLYKHNIITSDTLLLGGAPFVARCKTNKKNARFRKCGWRFKDLLSKCEDLCKDLLSKCLSFQNSPNENPVKNRIFPIYKIGTPRKILLLRYVIFKDFKLNVLLHATL